MSYPEIDRLAKKWQEGTLNEEERARFEAWYRSFDDSTLEIDSDEGEEAMKSRLYRQIIEKGMGTATRPARRRILWVRSVAAAIAFLAIFGWYWDYQNGFTDKPWIAFKQVRAGQSVRQETLPDGSIVWLRPGASLRFSKRFRLRDVELTGEALFEVAKNEEKPFRVNVGNYVATVLGTSFHIRQSANPAEMELVVLTGKVAVSRQPEKKGKAKSPAPAGPPAAVLMPSQRLKTNDGLRADSITVDSVDVSVDNEYTAGTNYNMRFDDTPFEEVASRISNKFGVAVEADERRYRGCRVSADLSGQPLHYTAELVAAALDAQYEIKKDKIVLKGGGCL
ncbi:ferric-dicitrate binding protein FerR, regulates iron transport through sigma-19 [Parapedobacter composti]|uniref:Ferric-dicitrate binding protein FerR, regulates iron transport through sigma-19 n=1 Tax=Parapedobacter composti TaxID=623281 RepID=A0A1I1KDL9_9SPHI|nr:FecR family protein [Parapedobacter composti]SFC58886.1 ferric-dicitrate binding protein FerR, regulates iron transport through sigma-19 [Parapedobacter composti]